ncbi:hypothetical protein ACFQY4_25805 [Catellatospora bangladeshensis]|uniref:WD40 repeat domain-containing protein n=1 Tax=Catellatospora bangladeshensis TaxID=310355 RepID=A0A8J3NHY1_9ACTN|nr:hypothetical protein [Catellatospora bangladeshensis]GIF81627.1 hypothetical protein Cba03nite_29760 [Catellatospora bangladeshensis]
MSLGQHLRAIADEQPQPPVPADLFQRSRRRARTRRVTTAGLALVAMAGLSSALGAGGTAPHQSVAGPDLLRDLAGPGLGGPLGWLLLAALLGLLAWRWRAAPRATLLRRLALTAVAGTLLVIAAPPGAALWGEPHGQRPGLPDRFAAPSTWTWVAEIRQSPPGRVAMVLSGPDTHGGFEEGRAVFVAADGDRYRVLDVFSDPLDQPWTYEVGFGRIQLLSPDGRYLTVNQDVVDLATGAAPPVGPPRPPVAWSADGSRIVVGVPDVVDGGQRAWEVWDTRSHVLARTITLPAGATAGGVALSPDGARVAVEEGDRLAVYPVDGGEPVQWQLAGWRLGDGVAWSTDGSLLALVRRDGCPTCYHEAGQARAIRMVDPDTGQVVAGGEFAPLPAGAELAVQGWRGPDQLVAQVGGAVEVFTRGRAAPARLFDLPAGVTHVEIATDMLRLPPRPAGPATYGPPNLFFWYLLATFTAPLAALLCMDLIIRRVVRRQSAAARPPGPPAEGTGPPAEGTGPG